MSTTTQAGVDPVFDAASIRAFATAILHGDDEHRAWLTEAAEAHIAGAPMPAPRGKGTQPAALAPPAVVPEEVRRLLERASRAIGDFSMDGGAHADVLEEIDALLATPSGRADTPPAGDDDETHRCGICDEPLIAGQPVLTDVDLGTVHAACCGPERGSYVKDVETGEPLGPEDPIPAGQPYEADAPPAGGGVVEEASGQDEERGQAGRVTVLPSALWRALDAEAEIWSQDTDVAGWIAKMSTDGQSREKLDAIVRLCFEEGFYRGAIAARNGRSISDSIQEASERALAAAPAAPEPAADKPYEKARAIAEAAANRWDAFGDTAGINWLTDAIRAFPVSGTSAPEPAAGGERDLSDWLEARIEVAHKDSEAHPEGSGNRAFYRGQAIAYENALSAAEARSILSALSEAQDAGGGWQPISTAPKTDDDILVAASRFDDAGVEHRYTTISSYEDQPFRRGFRHRNGVWNATHWRPLPPPPTTPTDAGAEGGRS